MQLVAKIRSPDVHPSGLLHDCHPCHADCEGYEFQVEVKDGEIIVALPSSGFMAVYFKRSGSTFLTLRQRTKTDDQELLAQVFRTAVNKARELDWIV